MYISKKCKYHLVSMFQLHIQEEPYCFNTTGTVVLRPTSMAVQSMCHAILLYLSTRIDLSKSNKCYHDFKH